MDIESYFDSPDENHANSKLVKDYKVFDYSYIPQKPMMRDESKDIVEALKRFKISGIPTNMAVVGSRGCGKTLTMQYIKRIIDQRDSMDMEYINCRHHNTSFKIISKLLGNNKVMGFSLASLFERFVAKRKRKTVVVLDEINLMSPKDKNKEILYYLSRSEKPFMVIMLSNTPRILNQLDAATKSSLQPFPLYFKNYNAAHISEILLDRAQKGLHNWDGGQIHNISALTTSRTNSDARVAIKTLFYKIMTREKSIEQCFEDARRDIVLDQINDLSDANLIILFSAAISKSDLAKGIFTKYSKYSHHHGMKPFSYSYFYANLSYLQSLGLVALISTKVNRAYANKVMLTFDKSFAKQVYKLRFE